MFARIRKRKSLIITVAALITIATLAALPWVLWHVSSSRALDVLIVDKTVPTPNYRKHAGIHWVLKHEKIVQRETGRPLSLERDYAGMQYTPDGQPREVPVPATPTDFVYLADAYGVYEDDRRERSLGLRSRKIYGGMSAEEVARIVNNLRPDGTLVGEFNVLASPTVGQAREDLSDAFGVRWAGWIGRHFSYLDLTVDLPLWVPRQWKRQTGRQWKFRGPGYIFVNEQGHLIVLVEGIDTPTPALRVESPSSVTDRYGMASSQTYDYWFEVLEAQPGTEVLSTFNLELTPSGRRKLKGVPVDKPFPAVLRRVTDERLSYYFAGDFADRPNVSNAYRYKWLPEIRAWLGAEHRDDQEAFYWRVYVPLMQTIVDETSDRVSGRVSTEPA